MHIWHKLNYEWYQRSLKRQIDLIASGLGLLFLSPVIGIVAVSVRLTLGRPVLFRQARAGLFGRSFTILKFRTMADIRDSTGTLLPDDQRITWIGSVLRATSLDELPELWNVLRGDMSLVGPRPLLVEYLPHYSTEQRRRHCVRPGVTGLAQINGRNRTTWTDRLAWDVYYVDNYGLLLDCRIVVRTLATFWRSDGGIAVAKTLGKFTATAKALSDEKSGCGGSSPVTTDQRQ